MKLFCCSLYGSVLWDLDHSNIDALCCTWWAGLRRVWNISYRTHCNILPLLSNALPMYDKICKRTVNFIKSCLNSDCVLVNRLTYRGIHFEQMRSPIGKNALTCGKRYSVYNIIKFDNSTVRHWYESNISEELRSTVLLLLDMIFVRNGSFYVGNNGAPFCSHHDFVSLISLICTA